MAAVAADGLAAHRPAVRGLLLRLVRDAGLADDLTQAALERATRAAASARGEAATRTWLAAIALNLARDHFRAAKRAPTFTDLEAAADVAAPDDPEATVLRAEMSACILGHIDRLPPESREVVLMHHFAGLSHREIAAARNVSEGYARVLLHRGMAALKRSLARDCTITLGAAIPCEKR